jgi:cobalt-zinc-cadmium resistance protein CzcA
MDEALAAETYGNAYSFSQPIEVRVQELIAGVRADVGISLYGDDLPTLVAKGQEIAAVLETIPGAADVGAERVAGLPYLRVRIKRDQLARHGIHARQVLEVVEAIGGVEVDQVYEGQRRFPLRVRMAPQYRGNLEQLRQIKVPDAWGRQIPLEQLAELVEEDGPAQISRDAICRRTLIQCNVRGRDLASFVAQAQAAVAQEVALPPGYHLAWGGQFKNLQDATRRLMVAVPLTLVSIFVLLFAAVHSARLAILIYLNVPIAVTGGIFALYVAGLPFSISAGVGFIALSGVAVLDGVVLVNHIVELRRAGLPLDDAVFQGTLTRLRPVLMTTLVAGLGFVPMVISQGMGAEVQRPLAILVIGGLVTSTLLTLCVLPAVYRFFEPAALCVDRGATLPDVLRDHPETHHAASPIPAPHLLGVATHPVRSKADR